MKIHKCTDGHSRAFVRLEFTADEWDLAGAWAAESFGDTTTLPATRAQVETTLRDCLKTHGTAGPEYGFDNWDAPSDPLIDRIRELFPEMDNRRKEQ